MADNTSLGDRTTPKGFWLIAVVGLIWNGFGAYDYLMSNLRGDAYFRQMGMSEAQIAYMHAYPGWMVGVWALGVWGAALGAVLLILRSRWALHALAASLLGLLGSLVYTYVLTNGGSVMGQSGMIMNVVITAAAVFFVWYAWRMTKQGVLR